MDTTAQLWDLRKYCLSHGMSGIHYSCCPPAGQTSLLGYLTRVASVIDGQCRDTELDIGICCGGFWHNERNILDYILHAMLSRCPAIWIMTGRISSSGRYVRKAS